LESGQPIYVLGGLAAAYSRFGMVKHAYGIVDCFSIAGIQA